MKVCIIDNYDSFTYNIVHLLQKIDCNVVVFKNICTIKDIVECNPDKIIISPNIWFNDSTIDTSDIVPKSWIRI